MQSFAEGRLHHVGGEVQPQALRQGQVTIQFLLWPAPQETWETQDYAGNVIWSKPELIQALPQ